MTQWQGSPSYSYSTAPRRNTVGLIAFILAVVGAVFAVATAVVPMSLFLSIGLLFAAFVLSIIGLTRHGVGKTTSILALVGSIVFGVVGPMLFTGKFLNDVGAALTEGSTPNTSEAAALGETVANSAGVAFTVDKVTCGKKSVKDQFGTKTKARGEFCIVRVHIHNGSSEMVTFSTSDVTGVIGEASFTPESSLSDLGGEMFLANINPRLSLDATFPIDVPAGAELEYVELRPTWSFQDAVVVKVQ